MVDMVPMASKADAVGNAEMYTRGGMAEDNRGESMVQKHTKALQQEKEDKALAAMVELLPQLGMSVKARALQEAAFNVDDAVRMLEIFKSQNHDRLAAMHKKREALRGAEAEALKLAGQAGSDGASSSGSSSDSDSDSGARKRKRKSSRSGKGSKKGSKKEGKRSKKEAKRSKKERRAGKAAKGAASIADNYGKYGIIRETDKGAKHSEFTLWALEVKGKDPESMMKADELELFKDFMEDYNTGTMPHRKYYNLEAYEREHAAKTGQKMGAHTKKAMGILDDEEALRRQREEERARAASERMAQALDELKSGGKAADMREQELLRMQMQIAYKTGDKKKAQQLADRLMPDEERKLKGLLVKP